MTSQDKPAVDAEPHRPQPLPDRASVREARQSGSVWLHEQMEAAGSRVHRTRTLVEETTPSSAWRKTITLRDGTRVTLRPIGLQDRPLLAASFERLSEESRYRRFLTAKSRLSAAELEYFVDVDHVNHEAIVAVERFGGEGLGVARYIRWADDGEVAEVAVTVADDWQRRGIGRALLDRLTYRARREGVRRFSALVLSDNLASLQLLASVGETHRQSDTDVIELLIELPPKRGIGAQLARALRAVAAETMVPAHTLAQRVVEDV